MMAKEDSDSANGCDEVGMSVANDEDLSGMGRSERMLSRIVWSALPL